MSQTITKQTLSIDTPATISYTAATDTTIDFDNSGSGFRLLFIKNDGASAVTCTVDSPTACDQGSYHDIEDSIAASAIKIFGPFNQTRFNDSDDNVNATLSTSDSVDVAVVEVPVV